MNGQPNHTIAEDKVETFVGQVVNDIAAAYSGVLTKVGHSLGLYKAMAQNGTVSPSELAEKTGTNQRYVLEWLNNQAAGGYIEYDPHHGRYQLPAEHVPVLADEDSPVFLAGSLGSLTAIYKIEEKLTEAFRTGGGIGWHEQDESLFYGTEYLFRTGYKAHLASEWIPALTGVEEKLRKGGRVADIGCGHGASSIIMAGHYPKSSFFGFDYHASSIEVARRRAKQAGVEQSVHFEVASAKDYPGSKYDLICFMDCFHDLGDPLGAAKHAFRSLAEDGSLLLVEPYAGDSIEQNLNPVGRLFYAASTAFCTPNSLSQEVGSAIGAQAGEPRYADIVFQAGFRKFKRATQTPFNLIFEARK